MHKIEPGPADKSYGIHVAKIAGFPEELLKRADAILTKLEGQAQQVPLADATPKKEVSSQVAEQMSLFEEETESTVITELKNLDLYNMTPMEVMMAVAELKKKL